MMRAAVKGAPVVATGVLLQTSPMSVMGFGERTSKSPRTSRARRRDHTGGFDDADLAAVLEEDRPEGERFPDGRR